MTTMARVVAMEKRNSEVWDGMPSAGDSGRNRWGRPSDDYGHEGGIPESYIAHARIAPVQTEPIQQHGVSSSPSSGPVPDGVFVFTSSGLPRWLPWFPVLRSQLPWPSCVGGKALAVPCREPSGPPRMNWPLTKDSASVLLTVPAKLNSTSTSLDGLQFNLHRRPPILPWPALRWQGQFAARSEANAPGGACSRSPGRLGPEQRSAGRDAGFSPRPFGVIGRRRPMTSIRLE